MEKLSKIALGVAVVALVVGGLAVAKPSTVTVKNLGAAGPDFYAELGAHNNETVGGSDLATSSAGTATYTAANIVNSRVIEHNATAALTVTLPTNALLSSAGFLPNPGDTKVLFIHASTTKITLAAGTNETLSSASTSLAISPNTTGRLDFIRLGATEAKLIQILLTQD